MNLLQDNKSVLAVAALMCLLIQPLAAQESAEPPLRGTQSALRDPFTPSSLMFQLVGMNANGSEAGFMPAVDGSRLPRMKLRGFVSDDGDTLLALLEVERLGTFMVREGDEINIDPTQPRSAIRISSITRLSVTVEAGTIGTIKILR